MKVEANYRGRGRWYPGKIKKERLDGTYDVDYDDGEAESRVPAEMIRVKDANLVGEDKDRSMSRSKAPILRLEEGMKVEANYRGRGRWYPGKIKLCRADGTFDIAFDDGESEMRVTEDRIKAIDGMNGDERELSPSKRRPAKLEEGMKVEANFRGRGRWYPGKIKKERLDGT